MEEQIIKKRINQLLDVTTLPPGTYIAARPKRFILVQAHLLMFSEDRTLIRIEPRGSVMMSSDPNREDLNLVNDVMDACESHAKWSLWGV